MATASQFAKRILRRSIQMEKGIESIKREVALAVHQEVVRATPVDTGQARLNWTLTSGRPSTTFIRVDPGMNPGAAIPMSDRAAESGFLRHILSSRPGQPIYVSNNAPYINELNWGKSAQAPAAFIQRAALAGARIARRARIWYGL